MRLSKTSEYALRILSYMINSDMQVFPAKHLIDALKVPDKYLRKLMTDLSKSGFIKSIQGRDGGYVFAKNANKIKLSDVIDAVEGMNRFNGCILGFDHCNENNPCSLHHTYASHRMSVLTYLKNTTIQELKNSSIIKF
jgi:Rrf2 family protein